MTQNSHKDREAIGAEHSIEVSLEQLIARYGERAVDYLDAAVVRKELTYDDYIETKSLLTLQNTLTDYHDELIFKVYHQQTELWFRLTLHEIERAIRVLISPVVAYDEVIESVVRINRYFEVLTHSFSVLLDGLSSEEFLIYRRAFGSSSGFQSAQFRAIEILCGLERGIAASHEGSSESRPKAERSAMQQDAEHQVAFYWERAARHLTTNEPTRTLLNFKEAHLDELNKLYESRKPFSLRLAFELVVRKQLQSEEATNEIYRQLLTDAGQTELNRIAKELLALDDAIVLWKQMHLRVAAKHLKKAPRGTGETNWAEYLAQSIAEQRCFPELRLAAQSIHKNIDIQ